MIEYVELADYLLIAEAVLGLPAEAIANFDRIGLADSALHEGGRSVLASRQEPFSSGRQQEMRLSGGR